MRRSFLILLLSLGFLAAALSCTDQKDEKLEEAYYHHQQANKIRAEIAQQLKAAQADAELQQDFADIRKLLHDWDENMVEVPGYEHEHHHHEGDHHQHNPPPKLTPAEHLALQRSLLDEIRQIQAEIIKK